MADLPSELFGDIPIKDDLNFKTSSKLQNLSNDYLEEIPYPDDLDDLENLLNSEESVVDNAKESYSKNLLNSEEYVLENVNDYMKENYPDAKLYKSKNKNTDIDDLEDLFTDSPKEKQVSEKLIDVDLDLDLSDLESGNKTKLTVDKNSEIGEISDVGDVDDLDDLDIEFDTNTDDVDVDTDLLNQSSDYNYRDKHYEMANTNFAPAPKLSQFKKQKDLTDNLTDSSLDTSNLLNTSEIELNTSYILNDTGYTTGDHYILKFAKPIHTVYVGNDDDKLYFVDAQDYPEYGKSIRSPDYIIDKGNANFIRKFDPETDKDVITTKDPINKKYKVPKQNIKPIIEKKFKTTKTNQKKFKTTKTTKNIESENTQDNDNNDNIDDLMNDLDLSDITPGNVDNITVDNDITSDITPDITRSDTSTTSVTKPNTKDLVDLSEITSNNSQTNDLIDLSEITDSESDSRNDVKGRKTENLLDLDLDNISNDTSSNTSSNTSSDTSKTIPVPPSTLSITTNSIPKAPLLPASSMSNYNYKIPKINKKLPVNKKSPVNRKSPGTPKTKASQFSIGTIKKGRNGKMFQVVKNNGKYRWDKCNKNCKTGANSPKKVSKRSKSPKRTIKKSSRSKSPKRSTKKTSKNVSKRSKSPKRSIKKTSKEGSKRSNKKTSKKGPKRSKSPKRSIKKTSKKGSKRSKSPKRPKSPKRSNKNVTKRSKSPKRGGGGEPVKKYKSNEIIYDSESDGNDDLLRKIDFLKIKEKLKKTLKK